ncbi:unnamed protein product [Adineta ricciae]|uniref:AB hydrolase-1 domain-containing protein n=1 Tax=Adineta ricciae TaxID=249248 RepID=A0A813YF82_ADIRI|nr:unnamed protein product [Adineta ricciae]CAF1127321.1 unnamed protein product [Adineta ricciae]
MTSNPTSHFVILKNRPVVQSSGDISCGSLKLHYWEWKGHQPTILLCHATSFHGRCYDPIINNALRGHHVIALDFRGHGRSQQHPPPYRFPWFGEDVLHFIETLNLSSRDLIGIGHSAGGYALTYAAAIASKRLFQYLILIDPGIVPHSTYGLGNKDHPSLEYILRRKTQWSSVEDMMSRLETREPFSRWPKDTLQSYCTFALDEDNQLRLSAQGEHSMYQSSMQNESNLFPIIEQSKFIPYTPIYVIRTALPLIIGRFDTSPTEPDLVKSFKQGSEIFLENATHLFPMENPQLLNDVLNRIFQKNELSKL